MTKHATDRDRDRVNVHTQQELDLALAAGKSPHCVGGPDPYSRIFMVSRDAIISATGQCEIIASGRAKVYAEGTLTRIYAYGDSTVHAVSGGYNTVWAAARATVLISGGATIYLRDHAMVHVLQIEGATIIHMWDKAELRTVGEAEGKRGWLEIWDYRKNPDYARAAKIYRAQIWGEVTRC